MTLAKINEITRPYGVHVERERNGRYSVFTDGAVVAECRYLSEVIEEAALFIEEVIQAWKRTDENS